jgi:thiamine phosphate synthase YjbQ (UPF0047 family)
VYCRVAQSRFTISTAGQGDAHDITDRVRKAIAGSGMDAGIATVFVVGSTAGITTIEFEPGAIADLNRLFDRLAPRGGGHCGTDDGSTAANASAMDPCVGSDRVPGLGTSRIRLAAGVTGRADDSLIRRFQPDTRGRIRASNVQW